MPRVAKQAAQLGAFTGGDRDEEEEEEEDSLQGESGSEGEGDDAGGYITQHIACWGRVRPAHAWTACSHSARGKMACC